MTPPEDDGGLKPIALLRAAEVPRAGRQELDEFHDDRKETKASLAMWWGLAFIAAAATAVLFPLGFVGYGLFLMFSIACGSVGAWRFWQLAGAKSWQALPEGASEKTAQLEEAAAKSVREWNWEAQKWNLDLKSLNEDAAAWKRRGSDPTARDEDWCQETHALERDTLMARGLDLGLRRKRLFANRDEIRRAARLLAERMRPPEPPDDDPKP